MDSRENTDTWDDFKEYLKEQYGVDIKENKKGQLRYFPNGKQDGEKGCPAKRLGEEYEKGEIERFFHEKEKGREFCYEPG